MSLSILPVIIIKPCFVLVWYPEATLEFQNKTSEPRQWCLSSFAPTYVKQDSGDIYRATYSAFRFTRQYGNLEPGQNIAVTVFFKSIWWGVMAERSGASDLCSDGWVVRMWVGIPAATMVLASLSNTINCNCFSTPRCLNGYMSGVEVVIVFD